jgi:hypothetical protein
MISQEAIIIIYQYLPIILKGIRWPGYSNMYYDVIIIYYALFTYSLYLDRLCVKKIVTH